MANASSARNLRLAAGAAGVGLALVGTSMLTSFGAKLKDPFEGETFKFPKDLANIDHWIQFSAEETKGTAVGAAESFLGSGSLVGSSIIGGHIFLPMTNNLSTDYHPTYSTPDLNMAAGSVLKPFDRALYGNNDIESSAAVGAGLAGVGAAILKGAGAGIEQKISKSKRRKYFTCIFYIC